MRHKYIKDHGIYHLGLVLFLILWAIFAYYARDNKQLEMMILVSMAALYILWGILHHALMHTLTAKIVVEYIAMASLGLAIALFLIKGFML